MVNKYIGKKWEEISKDTVECRAYNLGLAVGHYQLYEYIKQAKGQTYADLLVDMIDKPSNDSEAYVILKELILLSNKEVQTKAEKIIEALYEHKRNKRDDSELIMEIMKVLDKYKDR